MSQAIKDGQWVSIEYRNKNQNRTNFWISIQDVYEKKETHDPMLQVQFYNPNLSSKVEKAKLYFNAILAATPLSFTRYDVPSSLRRKLAESAALFPWLEYDAYSDNILDYYMACRRLDNDPSQKEGDLLPGIDVERLLKEREVVLNPEQEKVLTQSIIEKYTKEQKKQKSEYDFIISVASIDRAGRVYVVCYHNLSFNPSTKKLLIDPELSFNTTFLSRVFGDSEAKEIRFSLQGYVDMDVNDFIAICQTDLRQGLSILREGLHVGENMVNTRNEILILERPFVSNLEETYREIEREHQNRELPYPLRAFFGDVSRAYYHHHRKEPFLVIYDEKTNIDQIQALYNALKYPVTYVQGPPGTGKTQTLVNVLLSALFNKKTVLMTSGNNKPVDSIIRKLRFQYRNTEILFPWLRIGNAEEILKTTDRIRNLAKYEPSLSPDDNKLEKLFVNHSEKMKRLLTFLEQYEKKQEIWDTKNTLVQLLKHLNINDKMYSFLNKKVERTEEEEKSIPDVSNEDVVSLCNPVSNDYSFLQYLYFSSLKCILRLKGSRYQPLLEICRIEDEKKRVREFQNYLTDDDNVRLLNEAFPIFFCTNTSCSKIGTSRYKFDLSIMDEAGQCSIADALLPVARGRSILLLGDQSQLRPIVVLDQKTDNDLMEKYHVPPAFSYTQNSILTAMINNDNVSKFIFLSYHYRCGRKIISFSNDRYYGGKIKPRSPNGEGNVELHVVENDNVGTSQGYRNACYEEAKAIVRQIISEKMQNVTIVTPFANQASLINTMLEENGRKDIRAGTIHTMQGAENDTVILSTSISPKTSQRTYNWIKNNSELINVASTRAKKRYIVFADETAIQNLSHDEKDDLSQLIRFAKANGNIKVEPNEKYTVEIGYSNNSAREAEFWKTMCHLCSVYQDYTARRNVLESDVFQGLPDSESLKGEFDLVLYKKKKPIVAFEIDGIEHHNDPRTIRRDRQKERLAKERNLKLFRIGNHDVKDYELIKELLRTYAQQRKEEKQNHSSLFKRWFHH